MQPWRQLAQHIFPVARRNHHVEIVRFLRQPRRLQRSRFGQQHVHHKDRPRRLYQDRRKLPRRHRWLLHRSDHRLSLRYYLVQVGTIQDPSPAEAADQKLARRSRQDQVELAISVTVHGNSKQFNKLNVDKKI